MRIRDIKCSKNTFVKLLDLIARTLQKNGFKVIEFEGFNKFVKISENHLSQFLVNAAEYEKISVKNMEKVDKETYQSLVKFTEAIID